MKGQYVVFLLFVFTCGVRAQEKSTGSVVSIESSLAKLGQPGKHREAVEELKKGDPSVLKDLMQISKDKSKSREQRVGAILAAEKIVKENNSTSDKNIPSKDEISSSFVRLLAEDEDESIRQAAAISLGDMGDKKHIPTLKKALNDKSTKVRARAAWALAKMGDTSGKEAALKSLDDKSMGAQVVAVEAIEAIGDDSLIPELQKRLASQNIGTRINSELAIKSLEAKKLTGENRIAYIVRAFKEGKPETAQWAGMKLAADADADGPGKAAALKALMDCANDKNNPRAPHAARILKYLLGKNEK